MFGSALCFFGIKVGGKPHQHDDHDERDERAAEETIHSL